MPASQKPTGGCSSSSNGSVRMWGYLPAASVNRAPLTQPSPVPPPAPHEGWKAVSGGGCGFAVAISESGKIYTWGSATDPGHGQPVPEKQQVRPEAFALPDSAPIVQAAAGWAHCVAIADSGEVFTWGWSECVPHVKLEKEQEVLATNLVKDSRRKSQGKETLVSCARDHQNDGHDPVSPTISACNDGGSGSSGQRQLCPLNTISSDSQGEGENTPDTVEPSLKPIASKGCERVSWEANKRRKIGSLEEAPTADTPGSEDSISAPPCIVSLGVGIRIIAVAAGGRHTLALSDTGKVWGWGYGGEGQLGLGARLRTVAVPQLIPSLASDSFWNGHSHIPGTRIQAVACGGRHSAVVTDGGALLTFGWGLYGQCGQGCTEDELSPRHVSELAGLQVTGVAAGLWHTLCVTESGAVYAFGGNQFGQLGVGGDHAEMLPKLVEGDLDDETVVALDCGARHSVVLTDNGKVFCWGWNKYGQLGLGDTVDRDTPVQLNFVDEVVKSISCGWWHTLALVHDKDELPVER